MTFWAVGFQSVQKVAGSPPNLRARVPATGVASGVPNETLAVKVKGR